jgi:hypothetical protein
MVKNDMTAGQSVNMEPEIVSLGGFQAEEVVVGIGLPGKNLEAAGQFVSPAIGLGVCFSHEKKGIR